MLDKSKVEGLNGALLALRFDDAQRAKILRALTAPDGDENLLTTRDAAALVPIHPKTLLALGRRGILNPIRRSKRSIRWREDEVRRFRLGESCK